MSTPTSSNDKGTARRLLVTLFIASAVAAVTAGVALKDRHADEVVVEHAETTPTLPVGGAGRSDSSVPSAAEALQSGPAASGEPASTF